MAKDPAFLFYPGDWLGGTLGMSFEEKGAYMELLMMQFNIGHMSEHMIARMIGHHWDILKVKFKQDEKGLWYNVRLDEEKEKRKNFVNSRKNNIKGENQFTKVKHKTKHKKGHMTSHMENENVNEDVIIDLNIKKSKLQIFEELFSDEIWIENLARAHPRKDIKQAFEECYIHHSEKPSPPQEIWEWRQKLNTWLSIKKTSNGKGNTKEQHTNSIADTIRNTYGNIGGK